MTTTDTATTNHAQLAEMVCNDRAIIRQLVGDWTRPSLRLDFLR
jgi:hypothetical protein